MKKRRKWKLFRFPIKKEYVCKLKYLIAVTKHSGLCNIYEAIDDRVSYVEYVSGVEYHEKVFR